MKRVLIIEDESDLAELIAFNLENEGFRAMIALDALSALEALRDDPPDLVLLDLMLPGMSGLEICKLLKSREKTVGIPVIMVTAKGEEIDRVVGFEMGVDDYVTKPFSPRELLLRVKAVLRRSMPEESPSRVISIGPVSIDSERHLVVVDGEGVVLTTTEFKLLNTLASRLGRVQSRDRLLKDVWGMSHIGDTRTVDTHITRLRTKLGEAGEMIKTVRGFGYKMDRE
jgi:two-component system, OmpR family, phosphate regulon response regulator PhoB